MVLKSVKPEALDAEMAWIPGGTFRLGSDHRYAEEAPAHDVSVDTSTSHVGFRCIIRERSTS